MNRGPDQGESRGARTRTTRKQALFAGSRARGSDFSTNNTDVQYFVKPAGKIFFGLFSGGWSGQLSGRRSRKRLQRAVGTACLVKTFADSSCRSPDPDIATLLSGPPDLRTS